MSGVPRPIEIIGYRPRLGRFDPDITADYQDYKPGMKLDLEVFRSDLEHGVIPPGVLIRAEGGNKIGCVSGYYGNEFIEVV
jgi:hypothetical protein